jgi:hypothetical protein
LSVHIRARKPLNMPLHKPLNVTLTRKLRNYRQISPLHWPL